MKPYAQARFAVMILLISVSCAAQPSPEGPGPDDDPRASLWADPLEDYAGLPNLHRVSANLYRGAQPSESAGYAALAEMGIKTVINLRGGHDEEQLCRDRGLDYVYIPVKAWRFEEEDVIRFLQVAARPENQPVFVHCRRGADRTGMAVAVYRVVVEGWSKEDALFEMVQGPYDYNPKWKDLVRYVETMDVEKLREAAGLATVESAEIEAAGQR